MNDVLVKRLRDCSNPHCEECCEKCPYRNGYNGDHYCMDGLVDEAADAIDALLCEIEKYRHAAFLIGETCVEVDKQHITPDAALQKIRENIYYTRHE